MEYLSSSKLLEIARSQDQSVYCGSSEFVEFWEFFGIVSLTARDIPWPVLGEQVEEAANYFSLHRFSMFRCPNFVIHNVFGCISANSAEYFMNRQVGPIPVRIALSRAFWAPTIM